jgi:hypothetical protein
MGWKIASALLLTGLLFGLVVCVAGFFNDIVKLEKALWAKPWVGVLSLAVAGSCAFLLYKLALWIAYPIGDAWSLPPNRFEALFNWILSGLILIILAIGLWHRKRLRSLAWRLARRLETT